MKYIVALLMLSTAAYAEDKPRTIDFTTALSDPTTGEVLKECSKDSDPDPVTKRVTCAEYKPLTLGMVAYRSLLKPKDKASLNDTAARWRLQQRVLKGPQALSAADATTLITAINEFGFSTELAGQSMCLIDPTYCADK